MLTPLVAQEADGGGALQDLSVHALGRLEVAFNKPAQARPLNPAEHPALMSFLPSTSFKRVFGLPRI